MDGRRWCKNEGNTKYCDTEKHLVRVLKENDEDNIDRFSNTLYARTTRIRLALYLFQLHDRDAVIPISTCPVPMKMSCLIPNDL